MARYIERWRSVTGRERVGEDLINVTFLCADVCRLFVCSVGQQRAAEMVRGFARNSLPSFIDRLCRQSSARRSDHGRDAGLERGMQNRCKSRIVIRRNLANSPRLLGLGVLLRVGTADEPKDRSRLPHGTEYAEILARGCRLGFPDSVAQSECLSAAFLRRAIRGTAHAARRATFSDAAGTAATQVAGRTKDDDQIRCSFRFRTLLGRADITPSVHGGESLAGNESARI